MEAGIIFEGKNIFLAFPTRNNCLTVTVQASVPTSVTLISSFGLLRISMKFELPYASPQIQSIPKLGNMHGILYTILLGTKSLHTHYLKVTFRRCTIFFHKTLNMLYKYLQFNIKAIKRHKKYLSQN